MPITIERIEEQDLTVFVVEGTLLPGEQMEAIKSFYEGKTTSKVLWDFRDVKGGRSSYEEVDDILSYVKSREKQRVPGKTALLVSSVVDFGLSRMTETLSEVKEIPWQVRSFSFIEEAVAWLGVSYPEKR